jgi:hypothetical protein
MTTKALHYNEIVEKVYGLTLDEKEELKNLLEHNITVNYDLLIVFYFTGKKAKKAVFVDIGNHDEVY